ncbi:MAG TPA: SpoIIE family protein phosphatase [Flavobacteriales bacterium]|nr:SpoIIE family protein phosphatase [Flavobacteriales bacterium]
MQLEKGDTLYLFTDGYADQFGGNYGKKFMYKRLKELLIAISNDSPAQQKEKLHTNFNTWKGELDQVDDVCFIGIRL